MTKKGEEWIELNHVNVKTSPYFSFSLLLESSELSPLLSNRNNAFTLTEMSALTSSNYMVSTQLHSHLCTYKLPSFPPAYLSPLAYPSIAVQICSRKR